MSAQFGRWNFDGGPVDVKYLRKAKSIISVYGPDGEGSYSNGSIAIIYRAFHTTRESRGEVQPLSTASGVVITWDGRLDNRAELMESLGEVRAAESTDVSIVAGAYDRWGTGCFGKLIGDWALSIWVPYKHSLILARDPIGTRHLYYSFDRNQVTWSTILEPLVLLSETGFHLDEEYVAGWLSLFPAAHLTPYQEIHAVPPSCFVILRPESSMVKSYWDVDPRRRIVYATDREYEEHFRAVFGVAVRRRLRSDRPVLAELSGGMDSSSIVCMADTIIAQGTGGHPRLDTISYYDDSEPNWNERPYFTRVEEVRGRAGCHVDVGNQDSFKLALENDRFAVAPGADAGQRSEARRRFSDSLASQGNRVLLSGIGGDEVLGGVPTPVPELLDLLAGARFATLARQLKVWSLHQRKPWLYLLFRALREFFPPSLVGVSAEKQPAAWLKSGFIRSNRRALRGYQNRITVFGPRPTFQENLSTLDALRRQLSCFPPPADPLYEKRYPYLDRDLLEFICAIPREQQVRPGQRRSLMRRALVGIVPDEILNRRRKAYVARAPMAAVAADWPLLTELTRNLVTSSMGVVNPDAFVQVLQNARQGLEIPTVTAMRTLALECWLRNSKVKTILGRPASGLNGRFCDLPIRSV